MTRDYKCVRSILTDKLAYLTCSSRWYDDRWIFEGNSIKITDSGSSINDSSFLLSLFNACSRRGETCIEISFQITSRSALGGGEEEEILFFDNERIFAKTIYTDE